MILACYGRWEASGIGVTLTRLLQEYGALGLERQEAFAETVGEYRSWNVDLEAELLQLDGRRQYTVQVLGTESTVSNTWLWAWANEKAAWPEPVRRASVAMRELGQRYGVAELTDPMLSLEAVSGETLALIAVGAQAVQGYFPAGHESGIAFLLVRGEPSLLSIVSVPRIFLTATRQWPEVDHRAAFRTYCLGRGMQVSDNDDTSNAEDSSGNTVDATFDGVGRVVHVGLRAGPS